MLFLPAMITGGAGLLSTALEAGSSAAVNAANRAFAAQEAQKARRFNMRMSNTAWQRGVRDMRAAGLNPMLAFSKGPASSPNSPVGSATGTAPRFSALATGARDAAQLYLAEKKQGSEIALNEATAESAKANALKNVSEAKISAKNAQVMEDLAPVRKARAKEDLKFQKFDAIMDRVGQSIGVVNTGLGGFVRNIRRGLSGRDEPVIREGSRSEDRYLREAGSRGVRIEPMASSRVKRRRR